jgi:hypothetical protein
MIQFKTSLPKYYYVVKVLDPKGKDNQNYILETSCSDGGAIAHLMQSVTKYKIEVIDYGMKKPNGCYETHVLNNVVNAISRIRFYDIVEYEETIVIKKTRTVEL